MTVSVRMEPLLEKELEQAARRQGITKSQFIVDAVQRALGRKNPYDLLLQVQNQPLQVRERSVPYLAGKPVVAAADADRREASATVLGDASLSERLRQNLRAKHAASVHDWLAYQEAKKRGEAWVPDEQEPAA